jgi:hypothetical protein
MKRTLKNSLIFCGLLLAASLSFAQTHVVPFTTLSAAITSSSSQQNSFTLTSTTGITAGNTMLYIEGEADFVNAVNGTSVSVTRGQPSTRVGTHANGTLVWYGPPSYFQAQTPAGYPFGSCTRSTLFVVPYIDINNNIISDCLGGAWVTGDTVPLTVSPFRVLAPNGGGVVYTGLGTSTATVAGTFYCTEIDLPFNKLLTGLGKMNGVTATTDNHLVVLLDASGNVLASSAVAGVLAATASTYQTIAFTSKYFAVGPAQYFGCVQSNGTTATLNMIKTGMQDTYLTTSKTGVFGTIPTSITAPTTFTTLVGPYLFAY